MRKREREREMERNEGCPLKQFVRRYTEMARTYVRTFPYGPKVLCSTPQLCVNMKERDVLTDAQTRRHHTHTPTHAHTHTHIYVCTVRLLLYSMTGLKYSPYQNHISFL